LQHNSIGKPKTVAAQQYSGGGLDRIVANATTEICWKCSELRFGANFLAGNLGQTCGRPFYP
jgi:hypothetical protein